MKQEFCAASFGAANTPMGFFGFFEELQNPEREEQLFLIKGGPGTGKSTLMEQIARKAEKRKLPVERIYCSADPASLDAVRVGNGRFAVMDATAPHAMEPLCVGAYEEVLDLSAFLDDRKLQQKRKALLALAEENKALHRKTAGILGAAAALKRDSLRLGEQMLLEEKLRIYANNHAPKAKEGTRGLLHRRFLTAVHGRDIVCHAENMKSCRHILVIDDPIGTAASRLLSRLSEGCLQAGMEVYAYFCPLTPATGMEHLFVPALSLFCTTSNFIHPFTDNLPHRTIHATRFYDQSLLASVRGRLKFNRKMIRSLTKEAAANERHALNVHDEMEAIYRKAVLWEVQQQKMEEWMTRIFSPETERRSASFS